MEERSTIADSVRLQAVLAAISDAGLTILHQTLDYSYDVIENFPADWPRDDMLSATTTSDLFTRLQASQQLVSEKKTNQTIELNFRVRGQAIAVEARTIADCDAEGTLRGLFTILRNITGRRQREAALHSLLREVSHRSKNLLAIVQSIATQTAFSTDGVDAFLGRFRGRVQALASTQDLVTESDWKGAMMHSLLLAQFARIGESNLPRVRMSGVNPQLGPNAALHVGLAIHELAVNSVAFGALAEPERGEIAIVSKLVDNGTGKSLHFHWSEFGYHASTPPGVRRFGAMLLERVVPRSVGGSAVFEIGQTGVDYQLTIPAGQFEI